MAVMCGLCLSVHVLKSPQEFSPELSTFRQVSYDVQGFVLSGVNLTPQYLTSQFPPNTSKYNQSQITTYLFKILFPNNINDLLVLTTTLLF